MYYKSTEQRDKIQNTRTYSETSLIRLHYNHNEIINTNHVWNVKYIYDENSFPFISPSNCNFKQKLNTPTFIIHFWIKKKKFFFCNTLFDHDNISLKRIL